MFDDGTTLTVKTDPLRLQIARGGQVVIDQAAFVEVGVADDFAQARYYDAAAPKGVRFRVAQRATAWDAASHTLTLALDGDGGGSAALALDDGLVLDTAHTPNAVLARVVLPLAAGEELYGFGERFDTPAARGVVREMQLRLDVTAQAGTNDVHVPVPLAIYPARELALFAEERRPGAFDVGAARPDALLVTFATAKLALRILPGAPFAALDRYTARSGRPLAPPDWALLPMLWRNENASDAEVLGDAQMLRTLAIPGSTLWIDNPWQTAYNTFQFDARFGDPAKLVADLAALGFKLIVWSTPYVDAAAPTDGDHAEAVAGNFLITDGHGRAFDFPWQNGPGALVDFTAPGATDWWRARIARAVGLGIAGFKLDFGEDLVPEIGGNRTPFTLHDGGTDVWHNAYAGVYHAAYLGALPAGDGFLLTRAGAYGTQTMTTCVWPGDLDSDFGRRGGGKSGGLPAAIAGGLSLSASGFPFYGSDIGGFRNGPPTTEALARWSEYAALGTVMQLGGGGPSHNPWDPTLFGPEALTIYQTYSRLHTALHPYLLSLALKAAATGRPVTAPPGLVFPGHPYEDDFLTGDGLFVAPVVEDGARSRTVTLPPGDWIDWWTGTLQPGGAGITVAAPLDLLPLWRKAGELVVLLEQPIDTILPASASGVVSYSDRANAHELRVVVTPRDQASFALHDGGMLGVTSGAGVTLSATPGSRFDTFRFQVDWRNTSFSAPPASAGQLPVAADENALAACAAPGCWRYDATTGFASVRLVALTTATTVLLQ
jgi:alpha-D-xyloside xylohydrolase